MYKLPKLSTQSTKKVSLVLPSYVHSSKNAIFKCHITSIVHPQTTLKLINTRNVLFCTSTISIPEGALQITDKCVEMIKKLKTQDWVKNKENAKLRVIVEGGGCSGFQYNFNLDDAPEIADEDRLFKKDDATVVVDVESLKHINGATVDYKQELIRSSFVIVNNPNSEQNCGCGTSFSSKVKV